MVFFFAIAGTTTVHAEVPEPRAGTASTTVQPVQWERWQGSTVGWQIAGGLGAGTVGGLLFLLPVATTCDSDFACFGLGVLAGVGGATIGGIAGIQIAGALSGGDGSLWSTSLGFIVMGAAGLSAGFLLANTGTAGGVAGVALAISAPIAGGIIGYHLTASRSISAGFSVTPTDGGAVLSLGTRF